MDDRIGHRILKFEDSGTGVILNIPLADCAVLGGAEQTTVFEVEVIDLIYVTDQRSKLVHFVGLLIKLARIDSPVANKTITVARKHLNYILAVKAVCGELWTASNFSKGLGCV